MKLIVFVGVAVATFVGIAEMKAASSDEIAIKRQESLKRSGGMIVKPGSAKGKIAFIDTQGTMPAADIRDVMELLARGTRFTFEYVRMKPSDDYSALRGASKADFAVVIVDNDKISPLLIAPEDRWSVVNVGRVDRGLSTDEAKKRFLSSRRKKELLRAFSLLCGGGMSMYPGNVANATKLEDLDMLEAVLPIDMTQKYTRFLKDAGLEQKVMATYRKACVMGWAPAPTNEQQRAIMKEALQIRADIESGKKGK